MPLLSNKFSLPKLSVRKSKPIETKKEDNNLEDLSSNIPDEITLTPDGEKVLVFEDGNWVLDSDAPTGSHRDNTKTKEKLQKLQEENNLLRIKLEIIMNMLTETTAESHLQEKELHNLRAALAKAKKKK